MYTSITVWELMLLGQAAVDAAGNADVAEAVKVQSIWDFVVKGGPMMIPLGLCSLVALTVIIERLVSLRRRNVTPPGFLPGLKTTATKRSSTAKATAVRSQTCSPPGSKGWVSPSSGWKSTSRRRVSVRCLSCESTCAPWLLLHRSPRLWASWVRSSG